MIAIRLVADEGDELALWYSSDDGRARPTYTVRGRQFVSKSQRKVYDDDGRLTAIEVTVSPRWP